MRTTPALLSMVAVAVGACSPPQTPKDTTPPHWPRDAVISASSVTPGTAALSWPAAADTSSPLRYRLFRDGALAVETAALTADVADLVLGEGHVFKVEAGDSSDNWTSDGPAADVAGAPPAPRAPPLDSTVATTVCEATRFLYTGADAIQQGVIPGSLRCQAVAGLRGRVSASTGEGLGGVRVAIQGHPEWGFTLTQGNGQFDFVVEGGQHTIDFQRSGHLPAQRVVTVRAGRWGHPPPITLLKKDSRVTEVAPMTGGLHTSTPQTDKDGTRNTWLYFPPGTQTSLRFADGGSMSLSSIHVRATEYTVGPRGENAMPATLPPTSEYGFAAEFSVDEAVAAGAEGVDFDQRVTFFVDNFREIATGSVVPLGHYDRKKARWVADEDARVVSLVSVTGARADFDSDGDGTPDLVPGMTDAERVEAAKAFKVGASLWRGTVRHFTTFDCNYNSKCDGPCSVPILDLSSYTPTCDSCGTSGSDIDANNQTLGEDFDLVGTPFRLRYQSDRSLRPGQGAPFKLNIPWMAGAAPLEGAATAAILSVQVGGQQWDQVHDGKPTPGESTLFSWDGRDAYGRTLQGPMPVRVTLSYRNKTILVKGTLLDFNFLETGGPSLAAKDDGRGSLNVSRTWDGVLGTWYSDSAGLGGLSLSVLHQYVPSLGQLYRGDGTLVQADALGATLDTRVGGGASALQDIPGPQAQLFLPTHVAAAPDGLLYLNDTSRLVRRVALDGTVRTVAGIPFGGVDGNEVPAIQAGFTDISGLTADREGNLYVADFALHRIYKIDTAGIIHHFVGTGVSGYDGDGGPAVQARIKAPAGLAVTPDGDVYFLCVNTTGQQVVRRVREGVVSTVAGGGTQTDFSRDAVDAREARLRTSSESHLAFGLDGSLYFSEPIGAMVRRLGPDGRIYRVAGSGTAGFTGDNGPAQLARFSNPTGVAVRDDGSLYISDTTNQRVRRVRPDGIVETVAGNGMQATQGAKSGTPALRAALYQPQGLTVMPDGTVGLAERAGARVRLLRPSQAKAAGIDTLLLPSDDGSELYLFTDGGKHLKTLDALTRALKYQFNYLPTGKLDSIVDVFANKTQVIRDAAGNLQGIRSPDGLVTTLKLDAVGRATAVINPADEETKLVYGADGLLASLTDARGKTSRFEFDSTGRLKKDTNAAGGSKTLVRVTDRTLSTSTVTTAAGYVTSYQRRQTGSADVRTNTFPDGTVSTYVRNEDGLRQTVSTDLTTVTTQLSPDSRFGMSSPIPESVVVKTPSGKQRTVATTRTVTLANPADVLSETKVEDVVIVNGKTWKRTLDAALRTLTVTSPLGRVSSARFDTNGLLVEANEPGALPVRVSYDVRGRPVQVAQGLRATTVVWGSGAFPSGITDALARASEFQYDPAGRPTKLIRPDARFLKASYDPVGNVIQLIPPEKTAHDFGYTPSSLFESYQPPALSGVGNDGYVYDLDGLAKVTTHPDGTTSQYQRDPAGRLTKVKAPWGDYDFTYEPATGHVKSAAHGGQSLQWLHDGRLRTAETAVGSVNGTVGYTFDSDFRVASLSVNGAPIAYGFDDDGLLTQAGSLALARSPATGQLLSATQGLVASTWTYDAYGTLASSTVSVSGAVVFQEILTRDALARVTARVVTNQNVITDWTYSYDAAGRLLSVNCTS